MLDFLLFGAVRYYLPKGADVAVKFSKNERARVGKSTADQEIRNRQIVDVSNGFVSWFGSMHGRNAVFTVRQSLLIKA